VRSGSDFVFPDGDGGAGRGGSGSAAPPAGFTPVPRSPVSKALCVAIFLGVLVLAHAGRSGTGVPLVDAWRWGSTDEALWREGRAHMSSTTRYAHRTTGAGSGWVTEGKSAEAALVGEGWEATGVAMLARHGSRYATESKVAMVGLLVSGLVESNLGAGSSGEAVLVGVKEAAEEAVGGGTIPGELTPGGVEECRGLGRRLAARFPGVLGDGAARDSGPIRVQSTGKSRARASGEAFLSGLGPGTIRRVEWGEAKGLTEDYELRPFDACPRYVRYVKDTERRVLAPVAEFARAAVAVRLNRRQALGHDLEGKGFALGRPNAAPAMARDVEALWNLCKLEASVLLRPVEESASCGVLDEEERLLMEHVDDVTKLAGHGCADLEAYRIAGPLLASLRDSLVANQRAVADLRFAHAETLWPLVCLLEADVPFHDDPWSRRAAGTLQGERDLHAALWSNVAGYDWGRPSPRGVGGAGVDATRALARSSAVSPYAGNLVLARYDPPSKGRAAGGAQGQESAILLLLNEVPLPLRVGRCVDAAKAAGVPRGTCPLSAFSAYVDSLAALGVPLEAEALREECALPSDEEPETVTQADLER